MAKEGTKDGIKDGAVNFEIPAEMRAFAEKSVEQARQAFDTFMTAASHASSAVNRQAAGAQIGARELGVLAVRFAERNIASSFDFAQKLVRAKDAEEVMALHSEYVKQQMSTLNDQAKELGREAAKMGRPA